MAYTVLVIEECPQQLEHTVQLIRERLDYQVVTALGGEAAIEHFMLRRMPKPHIVFINMSMVGMPGCDVIRTLRRIDAHLPIAALTAPGKSDVISSAVRAGASDIIMMPASTHTLRLSFDNLLRQALLREEVERLTRLQKGRLSFDDIIGQDAHFRSMLQTARQAASTRIPALIEGEQGTGKELIGRVMHSHSSNADGPFVFLNCASMPDELFRQLFAKQPDLTQLSIPGLYHTSGLERLWQDGHGTLYLSHVECMPLEAQALLMERLKENEMVSHANSHPLSRIRLIAASCNSVKHAMQQDRFREDLYFKLSAFLLHTKPLVQRRDDIIPLAEFFISRSVVADQHPPCQLKADAKQLLMNYLWPGNVNELARIITRALVHCDGAALRAWHIAPHLNPHAFLSQEALVFQDEIKSGEANGLSLFNLDGNIKPIDQVEAETIRAAIEHYNGKMTEVAKRLGIGRSTLYRKLQDYNLEHAA